MSWKIVAHDCDSIGKSGALRRGGAAGVVSKLRDSASISSKTSDIGFIFDNDTHFLNLWLAKESPFDQRISCFLPEFEAYRAF